MSLGPVFSSAFAAGSLDRPTPAGRPVSCRNHPATPTPVSTTTATGTTPCRRSSPNHRLFAASVPRLAAAEAFQREHPPGMESGRQPQGARSPPRVTEHQAHGQERRQPAEHQPQIPPLPEDLGQENEPAQPAHLPDRHRPLRRAQEVQHREKNRDEPQRACRRRRPSDQPLERAAKKELLRARHRRCCYKEPRQRTPRHRRRCAGRVQARRPQAEAHQPQPAAGRRKTENEVPPPARVGCQPEVAPAADAQRPDRRPQQDQRGHEHRAVEVPAELEPGERVQRPPRPAQRVPGPIKGRGEQRAQEQRAQEVRGDFEGIGHGSGGRGQCRASVGARQVDKRRGGVHLEAMWDVRCGMWRCRN